MGLSNRQILYPIVGVIGLLVILVWIFFMVVSPKVTSFQFADLLPKDRVTRLFQSGRIVLLVIVLLGSVILVSRPQTISKDIVTNNGIDISLVLDVSYSMNAEDFSPNRMVAARDVLTKFVGTRESDRVGLVVFAGKPFVSMPLTFDYGIVGGVLERTTTESINQNVPGLQGTAVGDAMLSSLKQLENGLENQDSDIPREQVMILLTDGEANAGVDPLVVAQLAKEQGVTVYTVGIGSLEGGIISFASAFGTRTQQIPGVDETSLKAIAKATGGRYRRATNQKTFEEIFEEIASLETSDIDQENIFAGRDALGWLLRVLILGSLLLLIESYVFSYSGTKAFHRYVLFSILFLGVVALLNPGNTGKSSGGGATMVMLDVSTSMYVEDIDYNGQGISRIIAAKTMIQKAVVENPGSLFGLGVFAGEAVGILPVTSESNTLLSLLGGVDAGTLSKQGTSVNEALSVAVDRFLGSTDQEKTIVLITDGGEDSVIINDSLKKRIEDEDIRLVGIALGSEQGGPIPEARDRFGNPQYKQYQGETVISRVNGEALEKGFAVVDGEVDTVSSHTDFDILSSVVRSGGKGVNGGVQAGRGKRFCLWVMMLLFFVYCWSQTTIFTRGSENNE